MSDLTRAIEVIEALVFEIGDDGGGYLHIVFEGNCRDSDLDFCAGVVEENSEPEFLGAPQAYHAVIAALRPLSEEDRGQVIEAYWKRRGGADYV